MTNSEIREWYLRKVATIPDLVLQWEKEGIPLEERARRAWKIRHDARVEAREMMTDHVAVALVRARDLLKYGHSDGPTFKQLIDAARQRGMTHDEAYRQILAGAQTTNSFVDQIVSGKQPRNAKSPKRPN